MQSIGKFKATADDENTDDIHIWLDKSKIPDGKDVYEFEIRLDGVLRENMLDDDVQWLLIYDDSILTAIPSTVHIDNTTFDYDTFGYPTETPIWHR